MPNSNSNPNSSYDKLRDEIIAKQTYKNKIFPWKTGIAITIFGASLGLSLNNSENPLIDQKHLLFIIPVLTLYCDMLYYDCDRRIANIANFLIKDDPGGIYARYEKSLDNNYWVIVLRLMNVTSSVLIDIAIILVKDTDYDYSTHLCIGAIISITVSIFLWGHTGNQYKYGA